MSVFDPGRGRRAGQWATTAGAAALLIALSAFCAAADPSQDAKDIAEADKASAIWSIAEAEIIAERCPYATVDQRVRADFVERSHIHLEPTSEDGKLYAYRLEDRRDHFWARTEYEMCQRGVIGYGPQGISVKNLMILRAP